MSTTIPATPSSIDLRTNYLGLALDNPFIAGASPLVDDLGAVRKLEDAGVGAIVMHSLFEEQIETERARTLQDVDSNTDAFSEASSFFPKPDEYRLGPTAYLEQLRKIKAAVRVPVIASLNGITRSGWLDYARLIEQAGADALELNVYYVASDPTESAADVEQRTLEMVAAVRAASRIPIAVKLSPFFSSFSNFALRLEVAGARGLVLFNRFYQPDIDIEELEVRPELHLSDSSELLLRLRWLAILSGQRKLDLAASGGVHTALDAVKALMAGATAVQMVSSLLRQGPSHIKAMRDALGSWMSEHEYASLTELRGCMNLSRCPNPAAFERGNYMRILQSWKA